MNDSLPRQPSQNATPSSRSRGLALAAVGVLAAVGLFAGAWWWPQPSTRPAEPGLPPAMVPPVAARPAHLEPAQLPPPQVALESLSSDPAYARWLQMGGLVDRVAAAVAAVAEGNSPAEPLAFLAPQGAFKVAERNMGSKNVARIQDKLRELSNALEMQLARR